MEVWLCAGVGAALAWQVQILSQGSNVYTSGSSYGAPVVASFSGAGSHLALTTGNQPVYIGGTSECTTKVLTC
jgi:hypothetical protein